MAHFGFYSLVVCGTGFHSKVAHVSGVEAQLPENMVYQVGQWTIRNNWAEAGAVMVCTGAAMKGVSINIPDLFTTPVRDMFGKVSDEDLKEKLNFAQEKRKSPEAQGDSSDFSSMGNLAATMDEETENKTFKTPPTKKAHVKESVPTLTPDAVIAPPVGNGGKVQGSGHKKA